MVSEQRWQSYAAAVTGSEDSGEDNSPEQLANQGTPIAPQLNPNMEDFQNPFYLHISENSNSVLVSPPLTERNYNSWNRSMEIALEVKNKLGFVDGSIPMPIEGDPKFALWRRCNLIVCSWILKSLSPTIAESVLYQNNARQMWIDLQKRFLGGEKPETKRRNLSYRGEKKNIRGR